METDTANAPNRVWAIDFERSDKSAVCHRTGVDFLQLALQIRARLGDLGGDLDAGHAAAHDQQGLVRPQLVQAFPQPQRGRTAWACRQACPTWRPRFDGEPHEQRDALGADERPVQGGEEGAAADDGGVIGEQPHQLVGPAPYCRGQDFLHDPAGGGLVHLDARDQAA
ncbi:hypothetical protein ACQPXH_25145 [Nocardia sp. CA-135953]|uniref:hypothetical protein n=1 Tax=Nocardia sp. CA-135953 TaxID=3239978 RepID=UPI003D998E1C